jgi:hypothetical protein
VQFNDACKCFDSLGSSLQVIINLIRFNKENRMVVNKRELLKKWEGAKGNMSIKNIANSDIRGNMAVMLENQETTDFTNMSLLREASAGAINTGTLGGYTDGVAASDSYIFKPIALALVRRTFPDLFAHKVCGVQAMSTPVGLAYALRATYVDGKNNEAAWDVVDQYAGYTGSQVGTSGIGYTSANNGTNYNGFNNTSATGAATSAAEGWTLSAGPWAITTTSGALSVPTGYGQWPQLKMRIDQKPIQATERKLAATYSLESAMDVRAMHGLDVEKEMLNFLQYEITAEMDREILTAIKTASIDTANGGAVLTSIDLTGNGTGIDGRWSGEKYMNIIASIVHQGNQIAVATRRGAGNFVIASPAICSALQCAGHPWVNLTSNVNAAHVMASVGKLQGSMDIYRDQYSTVDFATVGYKGPGISDAGVIFSPYVLGLTNRAINAQDFSPSIGVLSRYAISTSLLGAGRYYRTLSFYNTPRLIAGA